MSRHPSCAFADRIGGVTLIELMLSMVLGLVVIGGTTGVILANRQSYRTNEGLSQLQDSARTAFELLARDIRQAAVTGCDSNGRIGNVVQTATGSEWWKTWFGLRGFDGSEHDGAVAFGNAAGQRVSGTESLLVQGLDGSATAVQLHAPASATFRLNAATTSIAAGDIAMVCDFDHATIFAVTAYDSASRTVDYRRDEAGSPRNCSEGLGYPVNCSSVTGNVYTYAPSSPLGRLMAVDWFIGNNGREGGRSLYRHRMGASSEEMVTGISNMTVRYLEEGKAAFDMVSTVGNWANVTAVEITLTVDSTDLRISSDAAVNSGRLQRSFTNVITLRNRVS